MSVINVNCDSGFSSIVARITISVYIKNIFTKLLVNNTELGYHRLMHTLTSLSSCCNLFGHHWMALNSQLIHEILYIYIYSFFLSYEQWLLYTANLTLDTNSLNSAISIISN